MFKEVKWLNVIIIMSVSLIILFGGWFLYQENNIKNPILDNLRNIDGIKVDDLVLNTKEIKLDLSFVQIDDLQITYNKILDELEPYTNNREIKININSNSSDEMITIWNDSYFYIAEAIVQKKYSLIPETMEMIKRDYFLEKAVCTMDDNYIYIDLHQGDSSLYVVIPTDQYMEVNSLG